MRITELEAAGGAQPAGMEAHCHRVAQGVIAPHPQKPAVVQLGVYKGVQDRFQGPVFVVSLCPWKPEDGTAVSLGTVAASLTCSQLPWAATASSLT